MSDKPATIHLTIPVDLRKRAHLVAKRHSTTTRQLFRDGLVMRIEFLEQKERDYKNRDSEKREQRRARLSGGKTRTLGKPSIDTGEETPTADRAEKLYSQHAKLIFLALDKSPTEKMLRTQEAVEAVKKCFPLTHPGDAAIIARLEDGVVALARRAPERPAAPATTLASPTKETQATPLARMIDDLVGRVVDAKNIPSFGDTEEETETT